MTIGREDGQIRDSARADCELPPLGGTEQVSSVVNTSVSNRKPQNNRMMMALHVCCISPTRRRCRLAFQRSLRNVRKGSPRSIQRRLTWLAPYFASSGNAVSILGPDQAVIVLRGAARLTRRAALVHPRSPSSRHPALCPQRRSPRRRSSSKIPPLAIEISILVHQISDLEPRVRGSNPIACILGIQV